MYSFILSQQRRFIPAFILAVLLSAAFIFGVILNAKGATFTVNQPAGGSCFVVGYAVPISWSASTLSGVTNYGVYYTTDNGLTRTLIHHPVIGTSYDGWIPPSSLVGASLKIIVEAHDAGHIKLEEAMTASSFSIAQTSCGGGSAPPVPTSITGSQSGSIGMIGYYSAMLWPDPEGQQVKAVFDWGDNTAFGYSTFITPATNGTTSASVGHTWNTAGTYNVRVKAQDYNGMESIWSTFSFSVTIGSSGGSVPFAPTLSGPSSSINPVNVSWSSSVNATEYKLWRRSPSGVSGTWAQLTSAGYTGISFNDSGVTSGSSYDYHVNACNSYGCSVDSNILAVSVTSSTTSCPSDLSSDAKLGSGCHDMGNAYFNTGMTKYVKYDNYAVVYDCTVNYLTNCLTGGSTSGPYTLTITKSGTGSGVITSTPAGINCGTTCSYSFASGTNVTLNAVADSGSYFGGWSGYCAGTSSCTVAMNSASSATATFTTSSTTNNVDLAILDIYIENSTNYLSVKIGNLGNAQAPSGVGHLYIWIDNPPNPNWTYSLGTLANQAFLAPGGSAIVQPQVLTGAHTLKAWIDYNNVIVESNESNNSLEKSVGTSTISGAPIAPVGFSVSPDASLAKMTIYLTDASVDEDGFKIWRRVSGVSDWGSSPLYTIVSTSKSTTGNSYNYVDNTVTAGTYYDYKVNAYNTIGLSSDAGPVTYMKAPTSGTTPTSCPSAVASLLGVDGCHDMGNAYFNGGMTKYVKYDNYKTLYDCNVTFINNCTVGGSSTTIPYAPSGLQATSPSSAEINLTWFDNSSNEDGFKIYRKLSGDTAWPTAPLYTVGRGVVNYMDKTVTANVAYVYRVNSYNVYGMSPDSNYINITAGASTSDIPNAPYNLHLEPPPTASAIYLKWFDASNNETKFVIERSLSGKDSWASINQTGANINSFTDSTIVSGNVYDYRVYACKDTFCSGFAYLGGVSTSSTGTAPVVPSSLRLDPAPTASTIYLRWNDNSNNEDKFNLEKSLVTKEQWGSFGGQLPGNTTSFADSAIISGTYYDYRIQACLSGSGCSAYTYLYNVSNTSQNMQGGSLYGKVTTGSGVAVSGVFIDIRTSDGVNHLGIASLNDGTYRLDNIPAGTYNLSVHMPPDKQDFAPPPPKTITIITSQAILLDIKLTSGTKTIKGSVKRFDGRVVTDAEVGAWRLDAPGGAGARVDALGNYSLSVTGGKWNVGVRPISTTSDWNYNQPPILVEFAVGDSVEIRNIDLKVSSAGAFITGSIRKADGTIPPSFSVNVGFFDPTTRTGGGGGPLNADGTFKAAVAPGTYEINIFSNDPTLYTPNLTPVSVIEGQTLDIGKITLVKKGEVIKGRVTSSSGEAIVGVEVGAFILGSNNFIATKTYQDGSYQLSVFPGVWHVNINPSSLSGYSVNVEGRNVTVGVGVPAYADFIVVKAGSVLSGTVVDPSGNTISDFYGFVSVKPQEGFGLFTPGYGAPINLGSFSVSLPPGNYLVSVYPSYGSSYTPSNDIPVAVLAGSAAKISIVVTKNTSSIQGFVKDNTGKSVTSVRLMVFAANEKGFWQQGEVNFSTGQYKLNVAPGEWKVGVRVEDSAYAFVGPPITVTVQAGQIVTKDLILTAGSAILTGKVLGPNTKAISNVWVSADSHSFTQANATRPEQVSSYGAQTDLNGVYRINLPPGTYYIHAFIGAEREFLAPAEQVITIVGSETKTVDLNLRSANIILSGKALESRVGRPAFIWAWADKGGNASTQAAQDGSYTLKLASGRWHVGAMYERDRILFRSTEVIVDAASATDISQELILLDAKVQFPQVVSQNGSADSNQVVTNEKGVTINLPSNSVATAGSVSVTLTPTANSASQGITNVVGLAYEVDARDSSGASVNSLNVPLTISIPYDESDLHADETSLDMAYWDETAGVWQDVDSVVVDTVSNVVRGSVTHLTRFAIVRPADSTPPVAPSAVRAKVETNKITVSWSNPTTDFHSARVYRSLAVGEKGTKVADNVTATSWSDSTAENGVKYYYNVKAVDLAGNESLSLTQTLVTAGQATIGGVGPYPSGTLFRISDKPTVWYVENGIRKPITSPAVFESLFDWNNIKVITDSSHTDLYTEGSPVLLPDGALIKGSAPTVYVIADGKKLPISSAEAFNGLGYDWKNIKTLSDTDLNLHATGPIISSVASYPSGSLMQKEGDPTVWYADKGVRRGFPTLDVFNTRKFDFKNVIKVSADTLDSITVGTPLSYPDYTLVKGSGPEVYFVEDEKRRHITTAEIFNANQYDWNAIRTVPDEVLNFLPKGGNLE